MTGVNLSTGGSTSSHHHASPHSWRTFIYFYFVATLARPPEQWLVTEANVQSGPIFGSKKYKKLCTWLLIFNGQSCRHEMFLFLFQIFISCTAYLHFLQEFAIFHCYTSLGPGLGGLASEGPENSGQSYWLQWCLPTLRLSSMEPQNFSSSMMWGVLIIVIDKPLCREGL